MTKKIATLIAGVALTVGFSGAVAAQAQLFPYTTTSTAPSSSVVDASTTAMTSTTSTMSTTTTSTTMMDVSSTTTATGTATNTTTVAPTSVAAPVAISSGLVGQYLQIDGLKVMSISNTNFEGGPVTIWAANPGFSTMAANTSTVMPATTAAVVCTQFATDSASVGTGTACPTPPVATMTATSSSSSSSGTTYSPYSINVNSATQLLLDNRMPAALSSIMPGDTINVYGYYTNDGNLDAEIVRDVSTSNTVTVGGSTTTMSSTAALQAELDQLEALVLQLETELGVNVTSTTSTAMTPTTTVTTTLPISCPMIPAGATSTAGCPPASSTTSTTSSVIYQ